MQRVKKRRDGGWAREFVEAGTRRRVFYYWIGGVKAMKRHTDRVRANYWAALALRQSTADMDMNPRKALRASKALTHSIKARIFAAMRPDTARLMPLLARFRGRR